jgi:hypothetical protein
MSWVRSMCNYWGGSRLVCSLTVVTFEMTQLMRQHCLHRQHGMVQRPGCAWLKFTAMRVCCPLLLDCFPIIQPLPCATAIFSGVKLLPPAVTIMLIPANIAFCAPFPINLSRALPQLLYLPLPPTP